MAVRKVHVGAMIGAEGVIEPAAALALRMRQRLATTTEIWADLLDRTSVPLAPQPLEEHPFTGPVSAEKARSLVDAAATGLPSR